MEETEVATFDEWAARHGRKTNKDIHLHMQANLRSANRTKTFKRWQSVEYERLCEAAKKTREDYQIEVEAGRVVAPGRWERLEAIASGDPDREDVQAAKRILARRAQCSEEASDPEINSTEAEATKCLSPARTRSGWMPLFYYRRKSDGQPMVTASSHPSEREAIDAYMDAREEGQ